MVADTRRRLENLVAVLHGGGAGYAGAKVLETARALLAADAPADSGKMRELLERAYDLLASRAVEIDGQVEFLLAPRVAYALGEVVGLLWRDTTDELARELGLIQDAPPPHPRPYGVPS